MKITVDCVLTHQLSTLPSSSALARLLSASQVTQYEIPLEALVSTQYSLHATPDFPIAAISAAADGLDVGTAYWLRADPVHLVMQRDCFSLSAPVPLVVDSRHATSLVDSLNQHFSQDGLKFFLGKSGAWYLHLQQKQEVTTTLPSIALGKNIHHFLPQGANATKWISMLNEVQMLLHEHPANLARESVGDVAVNSVWFSGGGVMPATFKFLIPQSSSADLLQTKAALILASNIFYQGLAKWTGTDFKVIPESMDDFFIDNPNLENMSHVRLQLPDTDDLDSSWFNALLLLIKKRRVKHLVLNLGFYEKSIIAEIKPLDIYIDNFKFWRKPKPVLHYLS